MISIKVKTENDKSSAEIAIYGEDWMVQSEFRCAIQGMIKAIMADMPPKFEELKKAELQQTLSNCIDFICNM